MATAEPEFEGWAIVELMGHRRLGGELREVTIAGTRMLRIDIPKAPPVTQYYGGSAIFSITPTTEEIARAVASRSPPPVQRWELPQLGPASGGNGSDEGADDNGDDDPAAASDGMDF